MPRTARASVGGMCYHVLNRGNARAAVFLKRDDYVAFLKLLPLAVERLPMRVLAFCLMPKRNPLRANLVERAEDWQWSSLRKRLAGQPSELLHAGPIALPRDWRARVNRPQNEREVDALRRSIQRGTPFGTSPVSPEADQ